MWLVELVVAGILWVALVLVCATGGLVLAGVALVLLAAGMDWVLEQTPSATEEKCSRVEVEQTPSATEEDDSNGTATR